MYRVNSEGAQQQQLAVQAAAQLEAARKEGRRREEVLQHRVQEAQGEAEQLISGVLERDAQMRGLRRDQELAAQGARLAAEKLCHEQQLAQQVCGIGSAELQQYRLRREMAYLTGAACGGRALLIMVHGMILQERQHERERSQAEVLQLRQALAAHEEVVRRLQREVADTASAAVRRGLQGHHAEVLPVAGDTHAGLPSAAVPLSEGKLRLSCLG